MPRFCFSKAIMTLDTLYLTKAVYIAIVDHAREGNPQEVCGILRGQGAQVFGLVRGRNVAPDPIKDYVIDSQTLLRQFDFEEEGDEMVAIYHSHPISPAYPSASDAWNAHYPDLAYLICSLEEDEAPVVRAFRLMDHDVTLDAEAIRAALSLDETRPGRFAHYQVANAPLPLVLENSCRDVPVPFYIVYEASRETGKISSPHVVSVLEQQIEITPA
jgi:proteasome lid subunit RPN8/RPN11